MQKVYSLFLCYYSHTKNSTYTHFRIGYQANKKWQQNAIKCLARNNVSASVCVQGEGTWQEVGGKCIYYACSLIRNLCVLIELNAAVARVAGSCSNGQIAK